MSKENYEDPNEKILRNYYTRQLSSQEFAAILNENDFDINHVGNSILGVNDKTALMLACERGDEAIAKLLLEKEAKIDEQDFAGNTALNIASKYKHSGMVKLLLEHNANINLPDARGNTPLINACGFTARSDEALEIINALLEKNPNIDWQNDDGNSAVMSSHQSFNPQIVEALLKKTPNLDLKNKKGETALALYCQSICDRTYGFSTYVDSVGFVVDSSNFPLEKLKRSKGLETIKKLVEAGANTNISDNEKKTPLMHVCRFVGVKETEDKFFRQFLLSMESKIADYLLKNGADVSLCDNKGNTALMIANDNKNSKCCEILLKNGANEFDLKKAKPEYKFLTNHKDPKNISHHDGWKNFIHSITASIKNREAGKYPWITLNRDNSISFFTSSEDSEITGLQADHNKNFREEIKKPHILEQLQYQAKELGFKTIGDGPLLEELQNLDGTEYRLNLSPQNLDSILKLNPLYVGYRNEQSLLKLTKEFSLKEGVIRLFPVFQINETDFDVRAAGCQVMEMPTVQLMHLLPNYENEILPQHQARGNYFHWIPQEVADGLFLDRSNFGEILNKIFFDNGVSKISNWEDPNSFKILEKNRQNSGVKIVEMDEAAKDFYALYGNCSVEELNNCYSVELGTVAFLEALRENLDIKVTKNDSEKEKLTRAKENIDSMIERENERKNQIKPDTSIAQASAAQLYQNQIQEVRI